MNLSIFATALEQIDSVTKNIANLVETTLATKSNMTIAVSGGRSPVNLFEALSKLDLPWDKITITLVDERIVATNSSDSNEKLVKRHLLKNKAARAKFIGLVHSLTDNNINLAKAAEIGTIDLAILGMGEDGHTASIFPDCKELKQALNLKNKNSYIITNPLGAKYQRIGLSLSGLSTISYLLLNISGDIKLNVFREAMLRQSYNYPISHLIHNRPDIYIYWHE